MNLLLNLLPQTTVDLNQALINAAASVALLDPLVHQNCLTNFQLLIKADRRLYLHLIMEADLCLRKCNSVDIVKSLVNSIFDNYSGPPDSNAGLPIVKAALGLLEDHGHLHEAAPYLLEEIFEARLNWPEDMYEAAMAAGFSLFDVFPPAMQPILAHILHQTLKIRSHRLHLKVGIYYALLRKKALQT